jgi:hypothetical protein
VNLCNSWLNRAKITLCPPEGHSAHSAILFFLFSHTVLISCWHFLSKDFELIQCLSDVITNLLCQPVFLYSMYESDRWSCQQCIFNWDVVCVQKLTNSTGLKWNILSNTTSCSWFCDSVTRTLFNWFSVASLMKTWIRHQLTISNVLP